MAPSKSSGFSLLEIAIALAIVVILALVSIPMYQDYKTRSMATELMIKVDEMRTRLGVMAGTDEWKNRCDVSGAIDKRLLDWPHAKLDISLDASKPPKAVVLGVTSVQGQHQKLGVSIATEAHKQFEKNGLLQRTIAINDATAVYAVKLADAPNCATADAGAGPGAGGNPNTGGDSGNPPGTGTGNPPANGGGNPPTSTGGNPPGNTGGNPPSNTGSGGASGPGPTSTGGNPPATGGGNPPATGQSGSGNTGSPIPATGSNKPTGTGNTNTQPAASNPGNSGQGSPGNSGNAHNQGNQHNQNNPGQHKGHGK